MQDKIILSTTPVVLDRSVSAPVKTAAQQPTTIARCSSAPVPPVLQWPGREQVEITVRNTFLHVEDEMDEETSFLQACRRRTVHSCPFFSDSPEPAPEKSPKITAESPRSMASEAEPAQEPSPRDEVATPIAVPRPARQDGLVASQGHAATRHGAFDELMSWARQKHHAKNQRDAPWPASLHQARQESLRAGPDLPLRCADAERNVQDCKTKTKGTHAARAVGKRGEAQKPQKHQHAAEQESSVLLGAAPYYYAATGRHQTIQIDSPTTMKRTHKAGGQKRRGSERLWMQLLIDQSMLEPGFELVPKLIGRSGANTRGIFEATGVKTRVRGIGSGHLEERTGREAKVPLMLALSSDSDCAESFREAFLRSKQLLQDVAYRFKMFAKRNGWRRPSDPLFSIGETSRRTLSCLQPEDLHDVHIALHGDLGTYALSVKHAADY